MELKRTELLPGVWLSTIISDKMNNSSISINMLTQLQRETAAVNALIPNVLCCGTALLPDPDAISYKLTKLGIKSISPSVRKFGEIHAIGVKLVTEENFSSLPSAIELICSILVSPATKGGLLNQNYVDTMKTRLSEVEEYDENIYSYARHECLMAMCCYEDYSTPIYGEPQDTESVHYRRLTKEYRNLLQVCPIEIICCVPNHDNNIRNYFKDALSVMPRGEINYEIGTDIRLNAVEDKARIVNTSSGENDIVFSAGYRFGDCMDDTDFDSMGIMCGVLEKELANNTDFSEVSVVSDIHKGLFTVTGKHSNTTPEELISIVGAVLNRIAESDINDDIFSSAVKDYSYYEAQKGLSADTLEDFFISQTLCGLDYSPEELSEAALGTTKATVGSVASTCECDLIYLTDFT